MISKRFFIIGSIVILVFIAGSFFWAVRPVQGSPERRDGGIYIEIKRGMSVREIMNMFYERGIIRSPRAAEALSVLTGSAHALQAGTYFISPSLSTPEILSILRAGRVGRKIVIPEGATFKDIDAILASSGIMRSGDFLNTDWSFLKTQYSFLKTRASLEGYLFPDTYTFSPGESGESILRKFLANFTRKASGEFPELTYETLILASLVEKEVARYDDRLLVSGILHKRLEAGVGLAVDASLVYMKCAGTFLTCAERMLLARDKEIQSPYNTYLYHGLPPSPIGNPGEGAIIAALNPQTSDFWYYLSTKSTGETLFSKTLDEHNTNRLQYL